MARPAFESEFERANGFWHLYWSKKIGKNGSVRCTTDVILSVLKSERRLRRLVVQLSARSLEKSTTEPGSLVLRLGHCSCRYSQYRVASIRRLSSTDQVFRECSRPKHIGLLCGRLAGCGWPGNSHRLSYCDLDEKKVCGMVSGRVCLANGRIAAVCASCIPMVPAVAAAVHTIALDVPDPRLDNKHYSYLLCLASAHAWTAMVGS